MQNEHYEAQCYQCGSTVHFPIDNPWGSCQCGVLIILKEWPEGTPLSVKVPVFELDQNGREMKTGTAAI